MPNGLRESGAKRMTTKHNGGKEVPKRRPGIDINVDIEYGEA
jgi:hypothetical protein